METILLTCLQAQLLWGRMQNHPKITKQIKNELLYELKLVSPKNCSINAKPTERNANLQNK